MYKVTKAEAFAAATIGGVGEFVWNGQIDLCPDVYLEATI